MSYKQSKGEQSKEEHN